MSSQSDIDSKRLIERQDALLVQAERFFDSKRVPAKLAQAFCDTPRHLFAKRFYSPQHGRWIDLSEESASDHIAEIYADHPLGIFRDENEKTLSTISQPTFVLFMLDLLELQPGMKVFELGGGSGWNAAMIGRLVGPRGHVTSVEIIESLATTARSTIAELGLSQVQTIAGDASLGIAENAPYQRGIFTASAWDLPNCFFEQIENNGLLVFVMKIRAGIDLLTALRKTGTETFTSELHFPCSFVPVTGSHDQKKQEPIDVESPSLLKTIPWEQVNVSGEEIPSFISFVELIKDCQQSYLIENPEHGYGEEFSGFSVDDGQSLVLFNDDCVKTSAGEESLIELRRASKRWRKAGMPSIEDLNLSIHTVDSAPEPRNDQWLVQRASSVIGWSIA